MLVRKMGTTLYCQNASPKLKTSSLLPRCHLEIGIGAGSLLSNYIHKVVIKLTTAESSE